MDGVFPPASTNASADAPKASSPRKVQDSVAEKMEDEIVEDKTKAVQTPRSLTTEEKKTIAPISLLPEQKKEEGKTPTSATLKESSQKKMTNDEAKAARAKRFGITDEAKAARAKRFGITDEPKTAPTKRIGISDEAKAARAKRFGIPVQGDNDTKKKKQKIDKPSKDSKSEVSLTKKEIEQRIKRISRFGESTSIENKKKIDELKAMLRTYRFTNETKG